MSLKFAILTSLIEREGSGIELARRFDKSIGFFWPATHQQIYRELDRLATADLISELPLRICGYDEDWFVLPDLSANQGLRVRFRNAPGDFVGHLLTPDGAIKALPLMSKFQVAEQVVNRLAAIWRERYE